MFFRLFRYVSPLSLRVFEKLEINRHCCLLEFFNRKVNHAIKLVVLRGPTLNRRRSSLRNHETVSHSWNILYTALREARVRPRHGGENRIRDFPTESSSLENSMRGRVERLEKVEFYFLLTRAQIYA